MPVHSFHYLIWACLAAYSLHLLEEFTYDWKGWANKTLGLTADSPQFYFVSATAVILGICCAMINWWMAAISLMFPAYLIINAIFMHVVPAVVQRRIIPGLFSAVLLLLPSSCVTYYAAYRDDVLESWVVLVSILGAIAFVGFAVLLAKTKDRFRYMA